MNIHEATIWIAGFTDGEGTLTIGKIIREDRLSPQYRPMVRVTNTRPEAVEIFQQFYGGNIYPLHDSRTGESKRWATAYYWHCPDSQLKNFLTDIYPYLILKQKNAELILELIHYRDQSKHNYKGKGKGRGRAPLSQEEITFRENLYLQIQSLNRKGIDR